ncbi:uncharacterized protein A1O9_12612 [Exophiala aquamarina CBS 119918]|uniref:F-box domain-containing protein n=1 Tax=Exophiala aquamarina CBS 119918 TaxID=1182545 RepID=A0A072NV73_9EURO|nr:uncharacterized protein A1O9_12612 [Exophiala aquamarina CBS 119918]KEF51262.1 hypothetical protein A1O9_12612 [Exophiala aquamarina CBS 119918]
MPKRARTELDDAVDRNFVKKCRVGPRRSVSGLSDEILLRILSFLTFKDLLVAERVSARFRALATDREIWKARYYDAWVRSRVRRRTPIQQLYKAKQFAKPSQRLDYGQIPRLSAAADWKRLYKIRSNWDTGAARVREIEIAKAPSPPAVAKVHQNMVFTVDERAGLRAWSQNDGTRALRSQVKIRTSAQPTCMAVGTVGGETRVVLGFDDGGLSLYKFQSAQGFSVECSHTSLDGPLMAVTLAESHIMTISKTRFLSVYHTRSKEDSTVAGESLIPIARLQSDASFAPVSIALRKIPGAIIASIAYAFNRLQSGWCLGLQEIRLSNAGQVMNSRIASTIDTAVDAIKKDGHHWELTTRSTSSLPLPLHPQLTSAPTSLSYEHPFVVCSLSDNTLMSFLVLSNTDSLEIHTGRRLWGHTSGVCGVQVNGRGKVVSISSRGNEIRSWELEDVMTTVVPSRTSTAIKAVDGLAGVVAAMAQRRAGLGLALSEMEKEQALTRRWVGFDDEQVVILGDRGQSQIMALYDFT